MTNADLAASTGPVVVPLGDRSYPIHVVDGVVRDATSSGSFWRAFFDEADVRGDIALVTNDTIAPLYGARLRETFESLGRRVVLIVVRDGEAFKTAAMLDAIHDAMLEARFDRAVTVVALGGGVVGDVAGFAAATYQRGVRFVQVPTTLLAQVDSSVGGKTGINHRLGKNMIGAFHQPQGVVIDLATLDTLPLRELAGGLAEVIKYGASLDAAFFDWIEAHMPALLARDRAALTHAIRRSCEIKAAIVASDEREGGRRALLNFGHTFGHAIEGATGYGTWLHGEGVAAGMVIAARLSARLGLVDDDSVERLVGVIAAAGLPVEPPPLAVSEWRHWMASDKKADAGRLRFILMEGLGGSRVTPVDDAVVDALLSHYATSTAVHA
jgi:3-dehydroquinate synthase